MDHSDLPTFLAAERTALRKGPNALVLVEDMAGLSSTLAHLLRVGFRTIAALCPPELPIPVQFAQRIHR
ncbi:MAG: hypothetical protein ACK4OP_15260, partial [Gemmobacter sp.]